MRGPGVPCDDVELAWNRGIASVRRERLARDPICCGEPSSIRLIFARYSGREPQPPKALPIRILGVIEHLSS
jgi:hypothetical protein